MSRRTMRLPLALAAILATSVVSAGTATASNEAGELVIPALESGEPSRVSGASDTLTLEDVIRSADETFPPLQAAYMERDLRSQTELEARGAFDLRLQLDGDLRPEGFYENYTAGASVEQPTRLWGSRFYGGYRYGRGDFASYDGGRLTDSDGEVLAGVRVPLLRGGAIDPARARLQRAGLNVRSLDPELQLERVQVVRDASIAFWSWLAAGETIEIAEALVEVAESREAQIARRVELGQEPEIDILDNRRLVIERKARLRGAERDFLQASIRLSLFLRDPNGEPIVVGREALPETFPAEAPAARDAIEADLEFARTRHPLLKQLAIEREKLTVDVRLARNETLPSVDLKVEGSQDFGRSRAGIDEQGKLSTDPRSSTEVKALVRIEMPIWRREARGRLGAAQIRVGQLERRMRYLADQVVAEALQAVEALEAAHEQTGQARENLRLAQRLRDAEERRLELGLSNLIDVNIREVQAATAAQQLVDAQLAYFKALAQYTATIARPA